MDQKIREIVCGKCGKRHIISILRGFSGMADFTCPECKETTPVKGFLEIITPERAKAILSQANIHHKVVWGVFAVSTICCLVCCGIMQFRPESFEKPDAFSVILMIALNVSWYLPVIGMLLMIAALIEQGFLQYKLISVASAVVFVIAIYVQTKYYLSPSDLTLWLAYLAMTVVVAFFKAGRVMKEI